MNFIKKIVEKQIDEPVHKQFIRFGKGEYGGRFLLTLWKTKKIKLKTSFEFVNDLVLLCSEFGNCKVSGIVLSKENIAKILSEKNIKGNSETKKGGLYYQNNISDQELTPEQLIELEKASYATLLNIEGEGFKLKIKKKLPKPGKSEDKIDDKFCQLEADEKYYSKIKQYLFWDIPETKKVNIKHSVIVEKLIIPEGEKDYSKIRELAKRKGKIIRKIMIDNKETSKEIEFEA
ncbi:MAG: hypothetical protein KKF48_04720 [Nanoarchaeota archaeon]|nr:hypothetical protein [Nanoarchaeota archaeon]MBU1028320.1 hypothetical protein [Nanoarchaeota archaeon]